MTMIVAVENAHIVYNYCEYFHIEVLDAYVLI